ncbi:Lrp/AsnC family transcriptional regulator [Streptomyces sp. LBL]|uniref:Lrp/AsnC family transcriptional regulator n=1 Tax=Streptomyces sp. LBL TaxID=2940562 RepID=UPI002474C05F|nr:Lrp/AsnC family transcriptional regulator [Streptomyces sp. LBL]
MVDTLDAQILNALQIHPRVSWAQLGKILRVDPSTISRRWSTLTSRRQAWTSCSEGDATQLREEMISALVEISCAPGRREHVIGELGGQGSVSSVNCTSGPRDLYIMISTDSLLSMDRYIDERIAVIPGIVGLRTHYFRRIFFEGSSWRLHALSKEQVKALHDLRPSDPPKTRKPLHRAVVAALGADVRRSAADMQPELGRSLSMISRDIDAVLAANWVTWRVDFSHSLMGWSAAAALWLDVQPSDLERVVGSLRLLNHVRLCASVTGDANLAVFLWVRGLYEVDEIENRLTSIFPKVLVKDRWIVPRIAKRAGHLLDLDGRHVRLVPLGHHPVFED